MTIADMLTKHIRTDIHYRCRECKQKFNNCIIYQCYACGEHNRINKKGTITEHYYISIYSISKWWNPFSWGKTKEVK